MSPRSLALSLVAALFAFVGLTASASAAPSDLDKTFGTGGILMPSTAAGLAVPQTTIVQPDGKILVAGTSIGVPPVQDYKQTLIRFNSDGSLDQSFGTGGVSLVDYEAVGTVSEYISDVILMADGRIVTSGNAGEGVNQDSTVSRYLSNGSLDTTFGTGASGKRRYVQGNVNKPDFASDLATNGDNIFVAGTAFQSPDNDAYVMKLESDGEPDDDFGSGGPGTEYFHFVSDGPDNDYAKDLVRLNDGKLLLLTQCETASLNCAVVTRINPGNGAPDGTFGAAGHYKWEIAPNANVLDLVVQPGGRIVVGANPLDSYALKLRGIKPDGSGVDTAFGLAGNSEVKVPGMDFELESLTGTADGGVLAVGTVDGPARAATFVRATAGGAGLASFGTGGVAVIPGTAGATLNAATVQQDGRYIGVGFADADPSLRIVRLIGDGPEPVAPVTPTVPLTAKIKSPSKSKIKASKFKSISGTAAGTGLSKVEFAIQRIDKKLLKKKKRCLYVTGSRGKTKKFKAVKKKCAPKKFLTAKGTTSWSYKLKLKPGKYKLTVRAVAKTGTGSGCGCGKASIKEFSITK